MVRAGRSARVADRAAQPAAQPDAPAGHDSSRPGHVLAADLGIRNSLLLGLSVAFLATLIGVLIGLVAGYQRRLSADRVLSFIDGCSFLCLPSLPVLILLRHCCRAQRRCRWWRWSWCCSTGRFRPARSAPWRSAMREREFIHAAWFSGESRAAHRYAARSSPICGRGPSPTWSTRCWCRSPPKPALRSSGCRARNRRPWAPCCIGR